MAREEIDLGNINVVVQKMGYQTRTKEKLRRHRPRCLGNDRPIDFGVIMIVWSGEQEK